MKLAALVTVLFLAGCASLDNAQCAAAYDTGYRDAIMGLQRQDTLIEPICTRQGARLDMALYREGWLDGRMEAERRVPHTE
jgi:hypothetical protein